MNTRIFTAAVALALVLPAVSAETNAVRMMRGPDGKMAPVHRLSKEQMAEVQYRHTGGMIARPGSQKGRFVFVNCQSAASDELLQRNVDSLKGLTKYAMTLEKGAFSLPSPTVAGEASLFVIDDPAMPSLLCAPENRWAMVNLAPLKTGAGEKPAFFSARIQKELMRGFCLLAGAQDSNYPDSLMGKVFKAEDLDQFVEIQLPVDILQRVKKYPAGYGITPADEVPYNKACREGWAPAPTNKVQQQIWNRAHAIPRKPIKIEYNEKRDKGK